MIKGGVFVIRRNKQMQEKNREEDEENEEKFIILSDLTKSFKKITKTKSTVKYF